MKIYFITLFGAVFLALCAERPFIKTNELSAKNLRKFWVLALIVFLIIISGFRYQNYAHSDEYGYRYMVKFAIGQAFDHSQISLTSEWLFGLLVWVSANVFKDPQALILLCSIITTVLTVLYFAKYARPFWFPIFLYISSGAFLTSMNILRQYISVSIILWCYPLAKKRKLIPYLLLVAVAAAFHQSAWVMLPFYFVLRRSRFDFGTILILFAAIIAFVNFEGVMAVILPNTAYDHYLDDILHGYYGVKWIRVVAWLVPYSILLLFHRYFHIRCDVDYSILYAALIAACISIVSTQYVFAARIESYFALATYIGMAKIPELFSKKGGRSFVWAAMTILFFLFGIYQYMVQPQYYNILFDNVSGVL